MLGLYAHFACWPCEIHLQSGNQNVLVIYVKYVYSALCSMVDSSDFICVMYTCIHPPYMHVKYWYIWLFDQYGEHIYFWHTFDNKMWNKICIGCVIAYITKMFGTHAHPKCWQCKLYLHYDNQMFSDECQISVQCFFLYGWYHWLHMWSIHVHSSPVYTWEIFGMYGHFGEHIYL